MNDGTVHASEFRHYDSSYRSRSASNDPRPASSSSPRDRDQSHTPSPARPAPQQGDSFADPPGSQRATPQHISFRGDASSPSRARSSEISPSRNPPRSPAPQPRDAPPSSDSSSAPTSPSASPDPSSSSSPTRVKVRDLQHIQRFAEQDAEAFMATDPRSNAQQAATQRVPAKQYEISEMPVTDVIEMVAGLLTKITTTNDQQHEHLHRQISPTGSNLSTQASSVLAFHGKNIPSITILSYLSRIHKYCPTTYEVFLSLLVYFDRMTERVNALPLQSLRNASHQSLDRLARPQRHEFGSGEKRRRSSSLVERPASLMQARSGSNNSNSSWTSSTSTLVPDSYNEGGQAQVSQSALTDVNLDQYNLSQFFVVDSYNIHRLVIAGVTCASKFFSDVFYTNSRYAKVGGLPLAELNNLELQFLLLNDFRLSIPVEELEAYATMLVEFYAREIIAQHQPDGMECVTAEAH